jgi:hypothetical protein
MVELGHSWHQTTAGRIERGARGVSAEEVTGLAAALETTVVGLLDPMASGAPEDIDLGSRVLNLLPPHAARQLILNETRPWDTTQRSYVVLWSGNKPVNGGIPLDSEEGLAYLRQTLGGKAPADFIEKIVGLAREAMTPEWKAALRDAVEAEAAREAGGTAP